MTKKKIFILTFALIAFGSTSFSIYYFLNLSKKNKNLKKTEENKSSIIDHTEWEQIKRKTELQVIELPGTINYYEKATILTLATARVYKIYKDVGDPVHKNTLLATLNKKRLQLNYNQAINDIQSAKANYELTKAKYLEAQKSIERNIHDLDKEKANLITYKTEYENSLIEKKNREELLKIGGITLSDYNSFMTQFISTKASYYSALKEQQKNMIGYRDIDLKNNGYKKIKNREEWKKAVININTKIDYNELKVAEESLKSAEASLNQSKIMLKEADIISPISGVVAARNVEIGEMVNTETELFTIVALNPVYIVSSINEEKLYLLKKGQNAIFTVDAFPDKEYTGKLAIVSPVLDPKSRSLEIKILAKNPNNILKPGMFVRVKIIVKKQENKIIIPETSIIFHEQEKTDNKNSHKNGLVYIIKNARAYKREIIAGDKINKSYVILEGLKENELIITKSPEILKNKDGIQIFSPEEWKKVQTMIKEKGEKNEK